MMLSFHVSQPDDKVKFLYSIRIRVLQQHVLFPAFSMAQKVKIYYLLMSVFHEIMKKWDREGTKEFLFTKKNNFGTLSLIPTPSSAEVKEKVELYLYSPYGPSWPVVGWTLPLPLPLRLYCRDKIVYFTV
jgi:hypothetical protein